MEPYYRGSTLPWEGFRRYKDLITITCYEYRKTGKLRVQILAISVKYEDGIVSKSICTENGINEMDLRNNPEVFIFPIAIRAPAGHSPPADTHVIIDNEKITLPMGVNVALELQSGFHSFNIKALESIIVKHGLKPGGMAMNRLVTFFNPCAPWDPRSYRILGTKAVMRAIPSST